MKKIQDGESTMGKSVEFWSSRWLPNSAIGIIEPTDTRSRFTPLLLSKVIDQRNGEWKIDFLRNFLKPDDFNTIKAIPMGNFEVDDTLVWPLEKSGLYSVRSGYKCIFPIAKPRVIKNCSTSHSTPPGLWKSIWTSNIPPKIQLFLWKVMTGSLPLFLELVY